MWAKVKGNYVVRGLRCILVTFLLLQHSVLRVLTADCVICQFTYTEHFLVPGTSYILRVSSLSAAASVGLVAVVILARYSYIWYGRQYRN